MTKKQPNIILLVLDTQRAGRMSMYGYEKDTTPVVAEFAEEATTFEWPIAPAPWTVPSHGSMFTGLYPTVHQTTQSYATLPDEIPTVAELLAQNGYYTVGFCNNPLVSVLENGLRRGFNDFYNYSGAFPDIPDTGDESTTRKARRTASRLFQKIYSPMERIAGRSPLALKLAMTPLFVPIWSRLGRFKGDTKRSITDAADYFRYRMTTHKDQPVFMFINMMEAHLPYYPPRQIMEQWVPYLKKDREARDFLARFNVESYRWVAPLVEPFTDWQKQVLEDVYDAEIAYQDRQLRRLFRAIKRSGHEEDTMVIVLSDHGESHGDHDFMGHAFVNYNEVSHVPMMIRYPADGFKAGYRVPQKVSTRRVFHTMLEAAGIEHEAYDFTARDLSLVRSIEGKDPENEVVLAEAFPVMNFVNVMEMNQPEAIEQFRVRKLRRTLFEGDYKLTTVGGHADEFYDTSEDPDELNNLMDNQFGYENDILRLERELEAYATSLEAERDGIAAGDQIDYSDNPELLERLRGLGYIE